MDILLITISSLLIIIGIIGSIVPIIPGPPIAFGGLLLVHFTSKHPFSVEFLIPTKIVISIRRKYPP